ncbi:putative vacuolar membrane protein [Golovinomyces cichoracearum]|uniref:Putative vacuolar membrane protein n=1 Tax=Golovinomyces cichoracearum TaxID=62708 RepID=A0A420IZF7_9PEZI|nr:putative vacuolar membrane protein [Golovinomyces cichoracearum]
MGCSGRVKAEDIRPEQKWEFISLNDFHSSSCFTPIAYAYLWASLLISIAVYSVDTFTAVNLLAYDRWSSEIDPFIPLNISKWIFSACIIASWINLTFEHLRAMRVISRGAVAESYLDSLAARLQCTRLGRGRGWRRFLVFAELTKSKKGVEYVALFAYFSFQSWIRIIFCQGPRQVINALTLYSVLNLEYDLSQPDIGTGIMIFFKNIEVLAEKDRHQVLILSGMVFTLVIWGFGALSLFLAMVAYMLFLWHYIPDSDGSLSRYCERKINTRLAKIVSAKVNKAIEEEERRRLKEDARALAKGDITQIREATLPKIFGPSSQESLYENQKLGPAYTSRDSSFVERGGASVPLFGQTIERPSSRATTISSTSSYGPQAPFLKNSANIGYSRSASPIARNFNIAPIPSLSYRHENMSDLYPRPLNTSYKNSIQYAPNPVLNNYVEPFPRPGTAQSMARSGTANGLYLSSKNSSNLAQPGVDGQTYNLGFGGSPV